MRVFFSSPNCVNDYDFVSRSYETCSSIVQFCLDTIKYESASPNWLLPNQSNPRLLSPTQGITYLFYLVV